jgi:excinuclease UvrABC nuclease subunit
MEPSTLSPLFDHAAGFDPAVPIDALAKAVPARWVVYLLADEADRPVQLLCVRNLRYSLKRRLGDAAVEGPATKRVDYRALVRRIHWRRVDGPFEADLVYHAAARQLFPRTYRGMVGFRPAWFLHVDDAAQFPRYTRTTDLTLAKGALLGPVEDKHAAQRLVQLVEDAFDLCRYYNILVQAPHGQACAYKEMGKCPAPCDGSVSMEQYRRLIEWSRRVLADPADYVREQDRRMRQAAGELRFEAAAKIKSYVEQLQQLGRGPFRHVAALADFQFLALQPGPRAATAKAFLVTPGRVDPLLSVRDAAAVKPSELMRAALTGAGSSGTAGAVDAVGAEVVGVVAHHLFARKPVGALLPIATLDERAIAKGLRDLRKLPPAEEVEDEGVVKQWQEAPEVS